MADIIHAMWLIDEYAIILRRNVWLIPPIAPTNADVIIAAGTMYRVSEYKRYDRRERGAIFWIVIRIITWSHWSPSITLGNQKWKGAAPAFNNKATVKSVVARSPDDIIKDADIIIIEEPKAWIKKYFKAASEEYWLFLEEISGINDKRLSSSPIQAPNQEEEEMESVVPNIRVEKNKIWDEERGIKKRGSKTLMDGVWAHELD